MASGKGRVWRQPREPEWVEKSQHFLYKQIAAYATWKPNLIDVAFYSRVLGSEASQTETTLRFRTTQRSFQYSFIVSIYSTYIGLALEVQVMGMIWRHLFWKWIFLSRQTWNFYVGYWGAGKSCIPNAILSVYCWGIKSISRADIQTFLRESSGQICLQFVTDLSPQKEWESNWVWRRCWWPDFRAMSHHTEQNDGNGWVGFGFGLFGVVVGIWVTFVDGGRITRG